MSDELNNENEIVDENTDIIPEETNDIVENSDDTGTEIVNHVLNDFNDFLAEFFVQVYQNGDDYRLIISHSNKYSQKIMKTL